MSNTEKYNRIRPLKIWEILQRETDGDHPMGTEELRAKLTECGIQAHRTTIYEDIKLLNKWGYEVMAYRGRSNQYYVEDRQFSSPEIHILMDAVQAASFITHKKTDELVDKIADLAGSQKGLVLKKNIVQFNTTKSTNENIYYSVNEIVTAINNRQKIIFLYFDYNEKHERVYRRNGHHYVVSPVATVFADGHYYLVIYDKRYNKITHYRIDRMDKVEIIDEPVDPLPEKLDFDIATHKKQLFGMFSGVAQTVRLEMSRYLMDVVFDLFGEDTKITPHGEDKIRFSAEVQMSDLFFGWCSSFGQNLTILGPKEIKKQYEMYLGNIVRQHKSADETDQEI